MLRNPHTVYVTLLKMCTSSTLVIVMHIDRAESLVASLDEIEREEMF